MTSSHFVFSHPDFENELFEECARFGGTPFQVAKGLFEIDPVIRAQHKSSLVWARDEWAGVETVDVESIAKATSNLRTRSKQPWIQVTTSAHRRGELIELNFRSKSKQVAWHAKKHAWPEQAQGARSSPAFTLLSESRMAVCVTPREPLPGGDWTFIEDRKGPPSRAYLKLWEWGWRTVKLPKAGETALDLGASPGGWTWVLAQAGLTVRAFDRSPLSLKLTKSVASRIHFEKGDAFQITPVRAPKCEWVFCDVIAEPKRMVKLIEDWLPTDANLVFTIKFKGATDFAVIDHLSKVDRAVIRHLNVNKHEVTFWRLT